MQLSTSANAIHAYPRAWSDEHVVAQQVGGEFVIYDLRTDKVHQLNQTAAAVWKICDGHTSPTEMAESIARNHSIPFEQAEKLVRLTLDRLDDAGLLEGPAVHTLPAHSVNRRDLLRLLGGAALLPVVYTIAAPSAAHAQSLLCDPDIADCGDEGNCADECENAFAVCCCPDPNGACICTTCDDPGDCAEAEAQGCDCFRCNDLS